MVARVETRRRAGRALAVWGMARTLCPDRERATLAILTAIVALAWPTTVGQVLPIVAGLIGWCFSRRQTYLRPFTFGPD